MTAPATTFSRPSHLDRETRTIRIQALQAISFQSLISREWDELVQSVIEGRKQHPRSNQPRFNQGE